MEPGYCNILTIVVLAKAGSAAKIPVGTSVPCGKCMFDSQYLVSDVGWCTNREAQTQHHAGCLGDDTDQVEGGGGLVRRTAETKFIKKQVFRSSMKSN